MLPRVYPTVSHRDGLQSRLLYLTVEENSERAISFLIKMFLCRKYLVLYSILQILSCHGESDRIYPFKEARQKYDTRFKIILVAFTTQNNDLQYL